MDAIDILITNKEFILGVVYFGNKPNKDNTTMLTIVKAYQELTDEVINLDNCLTCGKNNVFEKIYLYCKENDLWQK